MLIRQLAFSLRAWSNPTPFARKPNILPLSPRDAADLAELRRRRAARLNGDHAPCH